MWSERLHFIQKIKKEAFGMQLTIRLPDEYKDKIDILVDKMGLKRSDIIRIALKQFIEENLRRDQRKLYEKVNALLGIAKSGIKDLGQRHRDYLMEKIEKLS
jgi:predicted DNA-binding protein